MDAAGDKSVQYGAEQAEEANTMVLFPNEEHAAAVSYSLEQETCNELECESFGSENDDVGQCSGSQRGYAANLKISSWPVLWGVLLTSGNRKMTKPQYQAMRIIADTFRSFHCAGDGTWKSKVFEEEDPKIGRNLAPTLPHYTTLLNTYKPLLFKWCTVRATDSKEFVDIRKAGERVKSYSSNGIPEMPVRIVLPSEYARADIATGQVFHLMCSTSLAHLQKNGGRCHSPSVQVEEYVDLWPVVAARDFFYSTPQQIAVDGFEDNVDLLAPFAEVGDAISISLLGHTTLCPHLASNFGLEISTDGYATVAGVIGTIWTVRYISREESDGFDTSCVSELPALDSSVDYRSPI